MTVTVVRDSIPASGRDGVPTETGPEVDLLQLLAVRKCRAYQPWTALAGFKGVDLRWHRGSLAGFDRPLGVTLFDELAVSLHVGMTEQQTRCTLAHELLHLERGPVLPERQAKEEAAIDMLTAKRLVDPVLFDLVLERWSDPKGSVAQVLWVDGRTFKRYAKWRRGVTARTALRVWDTSREAQPWPAPWIADPALAGPLPARFSANMSDRFPSL